MSVFSEKALAKINLTLDVGPRTTEGYHRLQSLVVFANVGDHLFFEPAPDLSLKIEGPYAKGLGTGSENLVLRAANALQKTTGCQKGAAIRLHKALPVASGLGGGSADAAAALRGLNRLWACGLSAADLEHIGQALGADVPVCVQSRPRLMSGYGENLHEVEAWPTLHGVLVNPGFALSTAQVFARFDEMNLSQRLGEQANFVASTAHEALRVLHTQNNALTRAAAALEPRLGAVLERLGHYPQAQFVRLCGSGATCLALTHGRDDAQDLAKALQTSQPAYWVQSVKLGGTE